MAKPPSELTVSVSKTVQEFLAGEPHPEKLQNALRYLSKWRVVLLSNAMESRSGSQVLSGPFKGLNYAVRASEGSRTARLLGAYEASLHPVIEAIIARAPEIILDIGSAEGYYAVGFARRLPQTRVMARDASASAQELCRTLALANGVADRVEIGGVINHNDFSLCTTARTVVVCDIEGAEEALLDPVAAPGLKAADILVECHDCLKPGISDRLAARFAATHRVTRIDRKIDDTGLPAWAEELSDLDRLLCLWEWRNGPTPWLWMEKL